MDMFPLRRRRRARGALVRRPPPLTYRRNCVMVAACTAGP